MSRVEKSIKGWGSPSRYFQGPNLMRVLPEYTSIYGNTAYAIIDQFFYDAMTIQLKEDYKNTGATIHTSIFNSEVTSERVASAAELAAKVKPAVIVAIGGGKTIDTAKAVADTLNLPLIVAPTSASTDAPTIALSVMYSEEGEHLCARNYMKNPDIVLMDSQIIADAPARFLVAGMADGLSTVFEARANAASDSNNYISGGYRRTRTGIAVAEACYEELIQNGYSALKAAEKHVVNEALEIVIEANSLMSGLGVENNGCSGSHSICEGISILPEDKKTFHGEKVGFGIICQLVAENAPAELIEEVLEFSVSVGIPVTLDDLFIENTPENIHAIAKHSMKSYWDTEPFFIDKDAVYAAITTADAIACEYKIAVDALPAYCKR